MRHEYKDPGTQDAHSLEMRLQRRNTIGIVRLDAQCVCVRLYT